MKYIILLLCCAMSLPGHAQKEDAALKPLKIGDKMPELSFKMANYPQATARFSQFKGKVVILDFWATWCSSCIAAFPKLEKLQHSYKEQVKIILVNARKTGDDTLKIGRFFSNWEKRNGVKLTLPSVILDEELAQLFPTNSIPHYAWIDENGKVKAVTSSYEVNSENIDALLKGKPFEPDQKIDININHPLFTNNAIPQNKHILGTMFLKGYLIGISKSGKESSVNGRITGKAFYNKSILDLYKVIIKKIRPGIEDKRIVIEVKDKTGLMCDTLKQSLEDWSHQNLYSYEMIVPEAEADKLDILMLADLNRYSGYKGNFQKRKIKYLGLISTGSEGKFKTKGGEIRSALDGRGVTRALQNAPFTHLLSWLGIITDRLVLNETKYSGNIDFETTGSDFGTVQKTLKQYNLSLVEKEAEVEVFVISDKK